MKQKWRVLILLICLSGIIHAQTTVSGDGYTISKKLIIQNNK